MKSLFTFIFLFIFSSVITYPQIVNISSEKSTYQTKAITTDKFFIKCTNHNPDFIKKDSLSFYQKKSEWQNIIDSFWGIGESLEKKRQIFNSFANYIQNNFPNFNGLNINWDSLRTYYYLQINDSTSRGYFSALMSNFAFKLRDFHVWAWDDSIEATPLNPGTPVYILGPVQDASHFGASLASLPDSNLLVVNVVPNHPLNLEPGDIIIGYEGIPWKKLTFELFESNIPKVGQFGAAERAIINSLLVNAGMNWHLFNTIDIIKFSTGDTLHLSTDSLLQLNVTETFYSNPQVPIKGIQMPDFNIYNHYGAVTYGKIENTNIGYIYLAKHWYENVDNEFEEAVNSLMDTDGLIIDIRANQGGFQNIYAGLSKLFNLNLQTLNILLRCSSTELFSLCVSQGTNIFNLVNDSKTFYDRPIAVLIGPNTISFGDVDAYTFKLHPTTRFFGRPTNGATSGGAFLNLDGWNSFCDNITLVYYNNPDKLLVREEFPVDEEVWLTKDDVANRHDTVVEKAIEWINNLVYGHALIKNKYFFKPGIDTLKISALVENPNSHQISSKVYIKNLSESFIDSLQLIKDGFSDKSEIWKGNYLVPNLEDVFSIALSAEDITSSSIFTTKNSTRFTTAGPLTIDSLLFLTGSSNLYYLRPFVRNHSNKSTIKNVKVNISCDESWISPVVTTVNIPDISPETVVGGTSWAIIRYDSTSHEYIHLKFEILSDGWAYWSDSIQFRIPTVGIEERPNQPLTFALEQNFPNPFNPATTIKYSIPVKDVGNRKFCTVQLTIYDVLGREIAILVNKKQKPGYYEVKWDASDQPSGIYFYRVTVGNYVKTKKMILLR